MKKTLFVMLLLVIISISGISYSQCTPEQYSLAEKGLEQITPELTGHINTLEYIATDLRALASKVKGDFQTCQIGLAVEIIESNAMRAWYDRLLLQNISSIKDAVNLSQMATILTFSKDPLSNGIHQLHGIHSRTKAKKQLKLYEGARDTMNAMMTVYDQAIAAIRAAISEGKVPSASEW
ncbi:MAG: hypothetical protein JRE24_02455 [Deltaproteobacteria bacterium]|nr:hypothetical protein [Deltaproteobacteria bacterium]